MYSTGFSPFPSHARKSRLVVSALNLCTMLLVVIGCSAFTCEKKPESPVIARVGNATLTLDDLQQRIPPEYSDKVTTEQILQYVKQWVDTELLYQEAKRRKIDKEEDIQRRIEQMKKDLLGTEVISRTSLETKAYTVSEDEIKAYYEKHMDTFVRDQDVIKYIEIVVPSLKTGWQVRNQVTRDNFLDLAVRHSTTPVQDPRDAPFVTLDRVPTALARVIATIRIGGTTAPIELDDGFHIVRIIDKQPSGSQQPVEEVRSKIVNILTTEARKSRLETFLSDLRLHSDYEINPERIPVPERDAAAGTPARPESDSIISQDE